MLNNLNLLENDKISNSIDLFQVTKTKTQTISETFQYISKSNQSDYIKSKHYNVLSEFQSWMEDNSLTNEFLVNSKKIEMFTKYDSFTKKLNLTRLSIPTFNKLVNDYLSQFGLTNKYNRIRKNKISKEKSMSLLSQENKALLEYVNNDYGSSLNENLEILKGDVKVIVNNLGKPDKNNLLIVSGEAGIGKTASVREVLDASKVKYKYIRGDIKNSGSFYKALYQNNENTILVIDDSDNIIKKNSKFKEFLLAITDKGRNRRITYLNNFDRDIKSSSNKSGKYEQNFLYKGSIICISNLPLNKMDEAFKSRALINIVDSDNESVLLAIEEKLDEFYKDINMKHKLATMQFLKDFAHFAERIDFRTYEKTLGYFSTLNHETAKVISLKKLQQGVL